MTHICVCNLTTIGSDNGLSAYSFTKMRLKVSSGKWQPFGLGPNVLTDQTHQSTAGSLENWKLTQISLLVSIHICHLTIFVYCILVSFYLKQSHAWNGVILFEIKCSCSPHQLKYNSEHHCLKEWQAVYLTTRINRTKYLTVVLDIVFLFMWKYL